MATAATSSVTDSTSSLVPVEGKISRLVSDSVLNHVFGANSRSLSTLPSCMATLTSSFSSAGPYVAAAAASNGASSSSSSSTSSNSSSSSISSVADSDPSWQEYARMLDDTHSNNSPALDASSDSPDSTADDSSPGPRLYSRDRQALSTTHPLTDKLEYGICSICSKPFLKHVIAAHIRSCLAENNTTLKSTIASSTASQTKSKRRSGQDSVGASGEDAKDTIKLNLAAYSKGSGSNSNSSGVHGSGNNSSGSANHNSSSSNGLSGGSNGKSSSTKAGTAANGDGGNDDDDFDDSQVGTGHSANSKINKQSKSKKESAKDNAKKRKASDAVSEAIEKPAPKKKKKQPPKVAPKPKGPVDIERQCGVPLPNGGFCARSLTCKSHSMGAKRNVPGRSQPYDVLLAAYQKKNQMKQAVLSSTAQLAEDMELANGPVDSDEEVDAVMDGVNRSFPVPIERTVLMPVRVKHHFFRMREMFASAFTRPI
ncbi:SCA7, zinc-binding domain-containing protein [Lipomyces oligophaga]|uniref:SCA7, zinc-binding domain-containing protein n=1 Tax=Lipomyces oligophaga TaxID=45792 RepID=UPI0034CF3322